MSEIRAALFDVDGVLVHAPDLFSHTYAKKHGLKTEDFDKFFSGQFLDAVTGKADLKNLIRSNRQLWKFGEPEQILGDWFEAENHPDSQLLGLIAAKRAAGMLVFLATDQEKYRAAYIKDTMFPNEFDGIFSSSEIGYRKKDPQYWAAVLREFSLRLPAVKPDSIAYFDDAAHNIETAQAAGLAAHLYEGIEQVERVLSS